MNLREAAEKVHEARARLTATRERLDQLDLERTRVRQMTEPAEEQRQPQAGRFERRLSFWTARIRGRAKS